MVDLLTYMAEQMNAINIPYAYGVWETTVAYPYFVGTYDETEYRYEDGATLGTFTLDGWSRGASAKMQLNSAANRIKDHFANNAQVTKASWKWDSFYFPYGKTEDGLNLFFVRYGGAQSIPSGEEGLYRIQIILFVNQWKGE